MAKPFTGYALIGGWNPRSSHGFVVLGITSEQRGQIYGRTIPDDYVTHRNLCDILYRFPDGTDPVFAVAAGARAQTEYARHVDGIAEARRTLSELERTQTARTLQAAKGL